MSAVRVKLNFEAMQILMRELQQTEMWAIYLMGQGKAMPDTVTKFATRECQRELAAEPGFIYTTLNILMYDMCAPDEIPGPLDGLRKHREQKQQAKNETNRLTPIGLVLADLPDGTLSTDLDFGKWIH